MSNPEYVDDDGHVLMLHSPTGKLIPVPFDPRRDVAAAVVPTVEIPSDELTCKYKGSLCLQPRARMRNGELHNLCALHRERANANQGRFDNKLRQRRHQGQDGDGDVDTSDAADQRVGGRSTAQDHSGQRLKSSWRVVRGLATNTLGMHAVDQTGHRPFVLAVESLRALLAGLILAIPAIDSLARDATGVAARL
jgi:hypothetical protein